VLKTRMSDPRSKKIHGLWPPLLLECDAAGRIDLAAIEAGTRHFAAAGVHGVYTADTASEFYTLEFEEWNELATHFRAVAHACKLPAGIGCTWTNQAGALRRIARARELGYDHIHLSQPYWFKLNDAAQRTFWRAVAEVAGDLPIVVYTGSQGQLPLDGALLRHLRDHCPAIAGTKSAGFDSVATVSLLLACPDLSHLVHETVLCAWVAQGAAGSFSNLVALCPALALRWFGLMAAGQWAEAFAIQVRVNCFYEEGLLPIRRAGYVADKAMFALGRVPGATRTLRPPYPAVPDDLFRGLEAAARRHLPEFAAAPPTYNA
jgi:dihydrodipicolinate synthase/N-acetylneuraminate lyase